MKQSHTEDARDGFGDEEEDEQQHIELGVEDMDVAENSDSSADAPASAPLACVDEDENSFFRMSDDEGDDGVGQSTTVGNGSSRTPGAPSGYSDILSRMATLRSLPAAGDGDGDEAEEADDEEDKDQDGGRGEEADEFGYSGPDIMKKPTGEEFEELLRDPCQLFKEEVVPRVLMLTRMCSEQGGGPIGSGNLFIFVAEEPFDEEEDEMAAEVAGEDAAYYGARYGMSYPGDGVMPFLFYAQNVCRDTTRPRIALGARLLDDYQGTVPEASLREVIKLYEAAPKRVQEVPDVSYLKKIRALVNIIEYLMKEANLVYVLVIRARSRADRLRVARNGYSTHYPIINLLSVLPVANKANEAPLHLERNMRNTSSSPSTDYLYNMMSPMCGAADY